MSERFVTYKDQEWPARRLRRHMAKGCIEPTPSGIMGALEKNGEMTARQLARMSSSPKEKDGLTKTERVIEALRVLYETGRVGMIEPKKQRGRPSYKFVIVK